MSFKHESWESSMSLDMELRWCLKAFQWCWSFVRTVLLWRRSFLCISRFILGVIHGNKTKKVQIKKCEGMLSCAFAFCVNIVFKSHDQKWSLLSLTLCVSPEKQSTCFSSIIPFSRPPKIILYRFSTKIKYCLFITSLSPCASLSPDFHTSHVPKCRCPRVPRLWVPCPTSPSHF